MQPPEQPPTPRERTSISSTHACTVSLLSIDLRQANPIQAFSQPTSGVLNQPVCSYKGQSLCGWVEGVKGIQGHFPDIFRISCPDPFLRSRSTEYQQAD